ncbi:hypothetical protein RHSIM_Rhsim09G0019700 [Rhododendron simsii]|uniref:Uncharacterized protein n=1 Tax=Rhododendron simsii TaxID=118357 RepID=A0A834GDJ5_RHOSS|nr:hypothetical protein RHSIM_Rhsim09G0019700 [Rhododendron simsii]
MMRARFLWFTIGFTSAAAAMTHFVFQDLWADRQSLSSQLQENFDAVDARVSNLEQVMPSNSTPPQCQVPVQPFCCHMAYHSAQVISIIGALRSTFLGWTTHPSQFMDNYGCPGVPLSSMTGLSWEQNFEPPLGSRDNKEDKWFGSSPRLLGQSHLEVGSTLTSLRTQLTLTRAPDISWSLYYAVF